MPDSATPSAQTRRLLVAEDNLINQRIVQELLRKEGYTVTAVAGGLEALEALEQEPFDALILDFQMPGLDGPGVMRAIRSHSDPVVRNLSVLLFTAEADEAALIALAPYGLAGTLKKPLDPRVLLSAVAALSQPGTRVPEGAEGDPPVAYLRKIAGGDATLMVELIDIFTEEAPAAIRSMQDSLAGGDGTQLLKIVHKIRSNYKYVGMAEGETLLAALEKDVEDGVRSETYPDRLGLLASLTSNFIEVLMRKKRELLRE